jgi:hypothetical protein
MVYGGFWYDKQTGRMELIPVQPTQPTQPARTTEPPTVSVRDHDLTQAARIDALSRTDTEVGHRMADDILCDMLEREGYYLTARAFRAMRKWYA